MKDEHKIELASNLADRELRKFWNINLGDIDIEEECIYYTDRAQNIYNSLYDEYRNMIDDVV